ncbi:MAG: ABC transporter permease, partial [Eubacteriales bacterium]|nr:ABC transporter permease [Eubacteriales bacterium]
MRDKLSGAFKTIGLPRIIIFSFFLLVVFGAYHYDLGLPALFGSVLRRWGMFGILVLAMVPAIQCGIGPNFGVSLGIVCGLLGSLLVIEFNVSSFLGPWGAITVAILLSTLFATLVGSGYGLLLNRVKGSEMTVSTYVGFSAIAFMNIWWVTLPFTSGEINWPIAGEGARTTINLASSFGELLNKAGGFYLYGEESTGLYVPTGLLLFFFLMCYIVYLFMKSKIGK